MGREWMLLDDQELRERVGRIETLLEEIESFEDPAARAKTAEMVQTLLELYGEGLGRIVESVGRLGSEDLKNELLGDELITHLLLLHGLHPVDVKTRVLGALDEVRPYLESHGGNVQFLGIGDGVARVRLEGSCDGCPSSTMTLKLAIEEAVQKAAPELEGVEAEGVAEPPPKPTVAFVAAPTMRKRKRKPQEENGASSWTTVGELDLLGGRMLAKEVSGEPVLFLKLAGNLYAYRDVCPGCGTSLEQGELRVADLTCSGCGRRYDARRAGRSLDDAPQSHLEPVPLLVGEDGTVKVAPPSAVG
jgi:Fe-S cluster biogenesis protein NfuA/nitrite reductase/ring-hydroxylating ferredoxin subunit